MASPISEIDDFSHCTVCLFAFDELCRKPKFLSCNHTFCLQCMKVCITIIIYTHIYKHCFCIYSHIFLLCVVDGQSFTRKQVGSIPCPTCRKETPCAVGKEKGLMTNNYALKLLSLSMALSTQRYWEPTHNRLVNIFKVDIQLHNEYSNVDSY